MHRIAAVAVALSFVPGLASGAELMAPWDPADLGAWRTRGQAEFAKPAGKGQTGKRCLEIQVGPGVKPNYPQFYRDFRAGIAAGDRFRVQVDVRGEGVSQDPGAYLAVEFLQGGRRVGIAHSQTGKANGAKGWETLNVPDASLPGGAIMRVSLILHATGTAWFDNLRVERIARGIRPFAGDQRIVRVAPQDVLHPRFGGVGYHVFYHCHETTPAHLNEVILKRWREVNPSFARVTHSWSWNEAKMAYVAEQMKVWQRTGTEVYLTTWGPPDCPTEASRQAYAKRVADMLEYFVVNQGCTNLKTFCLTNELSLKSWGSLRSDLPKFRAYHQAFADEFSARKLPVGLLATDAAPSASWHTIEWAARNMDDITAVYGGHHYINDYAVRDANFQPWFRQRLDWATGVARAKGKDFIIGEFGAKQARNTVNGKRNDACIYWGTEEEPFVAIQLAEAVIAALNAGVYALGNWTFADFPDEYRGNYQNKWGLFKWAGTDYSTRPHYYAYGLLTKYLRGPGKVLRATSNDPLVRVAALARESDGALTVVLVNRNPKSVRIELDVGRQPGRPLRRYVYDPHRPPHHPFGDLPEPDAMVVADGPRLGVELPAMSQTLLTTAYESTSPPPVVGVSVALSAKGARVSWQPVDAADLCYYRVYRAQGAGWKQVGSTIATSLRDPDGTPDDRYRVVAVDQSGNASK